MSPWRHLIAGLYWGYPICCILRFLIGPHGHQATHRGTIPTPQGQYVPCRIIHHPHKCET